MTEQEEFGIFLVGLASEITNNVARGLQNVGQNFTNQLAGLLTVICTQGVSQVVCPFEGEPTKYRDLIKSIEKSTCYKKMGMETNQKGLHTRPAGVLLVITFKGISLSIQKTVESNSNLSLR